ncbi:MAG: MFS transporter [Actinobacteria bacterium]|nr:MFS transporter [Actinomycetota bacterium]
MESRSRPQPGLQSRRWRWCWYLGVVGDPLATTDARPLDPLREPQYRRFWSAAFVSNTGGWMQNATIPYVVYQITGSAGDVGVAGFFHYVPFLLMGLVGGSLADRFPRRVLLVVFQLSQAGVAVALWAVVVSGSATTASLSALGFLSGLLGGVNTPIWQSFVAELVPRRLLLGAVTLNSAQFNAGRALGPFLAGIVIVVWGAAAAFLFNAASFAVVVVVIASIRVRSDERRRERPSETSIVEALRYVRRTPAILTCCGAVGLIAAFGSSLFNYLPVYGESEFTVTGAQLGLLLGASGIGAVIVTPILLGFQHRVEGAHRLAGAMAAYGASVVVIGAVPSYGVAVAALLVFGASYLVIAATMNTTIQIVVREDLRGKVIAIYLMCLTGGLPIGLLLWGQVAEAIGLRATTVAAGVSLVAVTVLFAWTGRFRAMAIDARSAGAGRGAAAQAVSERR